MTTMTRSDTSLASSRHHSATVALRVLLFWAAAAVLVSTAHLRLDPLSPLGGAAVTIASIATAAYSYTRFCARQRGITHALGVGIAWLTLAILTEVTLTSRLGHGWYALLGSPGHPLLRNLFLFVWIFAPALFSRREDNS